METNITCLKCLIKIEEINKTPCKFAILHHLVKFFIKSFISHSVILKLLNSIPSCIFLHAAYDAGMTETDWTGQQTGRTLGQVRGQDRGCCCTAVQASASLTIVASSNHLKLSFGRTRTL